MVRAAGYPERPVRIVIPFAAGAGTDAVGRLMALAEAYPDLKANTNFLKLQEDLGGVEDKLSAARRFFNNSVGEYNAQIESVPAVFFASKFGFSPREFFDVGPEKRAEIEVVPSVKF
jgi:LemA protein